MLHKHLSGGAHSVFVFVAGHRGHLPEDRLWVQAGGFGALTHLLEREPRIPTVPTLIDDGKEKQMLTQTVAGRPRHGERGRPGKRAVLLKQLPDGCPGLCWALSIGCENLGEQALRR